MEKAQLNETWLLLDSRGIGGIESHVHHLARELRDRWGPARVVFYARHGEHPLLQRLDRAGIPWSFLNGTFRGLLTALGKGPQLVHTHGYKAGILGRFAAAFHGVPVVSTFHAGEPGAGKVRLYNTIDWMTAPLAGAIAVSPDIQEKIVGGAHLVPNFVPLPDYQAGKCTVNPGPVAFVGRLSHEKGPDLFCRLAETLSEEMPDTDFIVIGDGPMRAELEERYGDAVHFAGQVDNMDERWSRIGLLCMTSRHEGLPLAALEAMAHGVPVAAFAVGDLPSLIKNNNNGWLAPPGDFARLVSHIRGWSKLDGRVRAKLSAEAWRTIEIRYAAHAVMPEIIEIYRKALAGSVSSAKRRGYGLC